MARAAVGTAEAVADVVRSSLGEQVLQPPARVERGYGNEGWLVTTAGGQRLAKIPVRWPGTERQRNAAAAARLALEAGVSTPQPLAIVDDAFGGRGIGVWEYLEGVDAVEVLPLLDESGRQRWFAELGHLLARLHSCTAHHYAPSVVDSAGHDTFAAAMDERLGKVLGRFDALGLELHDDVLNTLQGLRSLVEACAPSVTAVLAHNDVYVDNLLVAPGGHPILLDFEHARFWDAVQDFVKPTIFLQARFPDAVAAIRAGYEQRAPVPMFDERLHLAVGLELVWGLPFFHHWGDTTVVDLYRAQLKSWLEAA